MVQRVTRERIAREQRAAISRARQPPSVSGGRRAARDERRSTDLDLFHRLRAQGFSRAKAEALARGETVSEKGGVTFRVTSGGRKVEIEREGKVETTDVELARKAIEEQPKAQPVKKEPEVKTTVTPKEPSRFQQIRQRIQPRPRRVETFGIGAEERLEERRKTQREAEIERRVQLRIERGMTIEEAEARAQIPPLPVVKEEGRKFVRSREKVDTGEKLRADVSERQIVFQRIGKEGEVLETETQTAPEGEFFPKKETRSFLEEKGFKFTNGKTAVAPVKAHTLTALPKDIKTGDSKLFKQYVVSTRKLERKVQKSPLAAKSVEPTIAKSPLGKSIELSARKELERTKGFVRGPKVAAELPIAAVGATTALASSIATRGVGGTVAAGATAVAATVPKTFKESEMEARLELQQLGLSPIGRKKLTEEEEKRAFEIASRRAATEGEITGASATFATIPVAFKAARTGFQRIRPIKSTARTVKPTEAEIGDIGRRTQRIGTESEFDVFTKAGRTRGEFEFKKVASAEITPKTTTGKFAKAQITQEGTGKITGFVQKGPKGKIKSVVEPVETGFKGQLKPIKKTRYLRAKELKDATLGEHLDDILDIKPRPGIERKLKPSEKAFGVEGRSVVKIGEKQVRQKIKAETVRLSPQKKVAVTEDIVVRPTEAQRVAIRKAKVGTSPEAQSFEALGRFQEEALLKSGFKKPGISGFEDPTLTSVRVTTQQTRPAKFLSRFKAGRGKGIVAEEVKVTGKSEIDIFAPKRPTTVQRIARGKKRTKISKTFEEPSLDAPPTVAKPGAAPTPTGPGTFAQTIRKLTPKTVKDVTPSVKAAESAAVKQVEKAGKIVLRKELVAESQAAPARVVVTPISKRKFKGDQEFRRGTTVVPTEEITQVQKQRISPVAKTTQKALMATALGKATIQTPTVTPTQVPVQTQPPTITPTLTPKLTPVTTPTPTPKPPTTPGIVPPFTPFRTTFRTPVGGIIGFPGGGAPGVKRPRRGLGKRTFKFTPTLAGIYSGKTVASPPKGTFTGFEVRAPVKPKKKKGKKRRQLF